MFNFDLKHDKLDSLGALFENNNIVDRGIFHMHRSLPHLTEKESLDIVSFDLLRIQELFSEGVIEYVKHIQRINSQIISITMRLSSGSILKYVLSATRNTVPRLRFNFSVRGSVFEYDDACSYLNFDGNIEHVSSVSMTTELERIRKEIESLLEATHD